MSTPTMEEKTEKPEKKAKKEKVKRERKQFGFRLCISTVANGVETLTMVPLPEDCKPATNSYSAIKAAIKAALKAGKVQEISGKQLKILADNHPAFSFTCEIEERIIRNVVVKETEAEPK